MVNGGESFTANCLLFTANCLLSPLMYNQLTVFSRERVRAWLVGFDKGFLVVLVICLLAAWPFISRPSLPQATDAELHIFRLAELSRMVREGELYPRWAANFYYGYGYPIFNYYAPLSYYLGLGVELLPRLDAVDAVKALFVGGLITAGIGMYGLVRDYWGRRAGLVAAASYVFAPYIQFVDPHARGDLPEALSFSFFALALWALSRLHERPTRLRWMGAAGLVAAVILVHNLMAMVFFGLLLGWAFWLFFNAKPPRGKDAKYINSPVWVFGALGVGVGLAAIFWLPVALEQGAVNLSSLIGDGSHFDFRNHFLSFGELLSLPRRLDWGATEPDFSLNLGLGQWVLGALGLVALLFGKVRARGQGAYFGLMLVVILFLMLPVSTAVWERLPYLPYMQFPWRFLGPAAAMLAVLAGVATEAVGRLLPERMASYWAAGLVAAVLLPGLPLLEVPPWPDDFGPTDTKRVLEIELSGLWLGTTSTADFVPATVEVLPEPKARMVEALNEGRPLDRVNRVTLPEGTEVVTEQITPLHDRYHSTGEQDYPLRLFLFDFPGWEATVDGEPVATELGRPEGFIVIPVPAGEHTVEVHFKNTPVRLVAEVVSLLSLLGMLVVGWGLKNFNAEAQRGRDAKKGILVSDLRGGNRPVWIVGGVVLVVFGVYVLVLSPAGVLRYESQGYVAEPAENQVIENFGEQIALIGYDVPEAIRPGEQMDVTFYWQPWQPLDINYQVFVHLLAEDGSLVAQSDKLNPGDFPTGRWPLDKYVRDENTLAIPADLPPGTYRLSVGLWVAAEGWRLPVLDDDRTQIGDNVVVTEWQVEVE
jgi:hypothetical protein